MSIFLTPGSGLDLQLVEFAASGRSAQFLLKFAQAFREATMSGLKFRQIFFLLFCVIFNLNVESVRADAVFDLTGTFDDGSTVSGTFTIDLTTGHVDAINVLFKGVTYTTVLLQESFTGNTTAGQTPVPVAYHVAFGSLSLPLIDPFIRGTSAPDSLIGYLGGPLCSVSTPCGPDQQGNFWIGTYRPTISSGHVFESGQLTAEIPLPATLPLFATGIGVLGLLGWRRKRKAHAV
jgi:hypothetical protein